MLPYYEYFFKVAPNLRIMIYSGDVDVRLFPLTYVCLLASIVYFIIEPLFSHRLNADCHLPESIHSRVFGGTEAPDCREVETV